MKKIIFIIMLFAISFGALLNMSLIGSGNGLRTGTAHESSLTVTNGVSLWLLIPKGITKVSVSVNVLSNSASIEFTTVPVALVDGTAHFFTWPAGAVSTNTVDSLASPVSAIRIRGTGAVATMFVRAQ